MLEIAALVRRSARVVLLLLVRRPDEHYISFFRCVVLVKGRVRNSELWVS